MKEIMDAISLCRMIAKDGLKNGSYAETFEFVKQHFEHASFENELVKQQIEKLAHDIVELRNSYEYLK